jgi:hypothetical protein
MALPSTSDLLDLGLGLNDWLTDWLAGWLLV